LGTTYPIIVELTIELSTCAFHPFPEFFHAGRTNIFIREIRVKVFFDFEFKKTAGKRYLEKLSPLELSE